MQEHIVGKFALVHLTFGSCTSPTDNFPFIYRPFNAPACARWTISNALYLAIVGHPTSSEGSVKHKSLFRFTFTLRTIYEVNGKSQYLESCSPATNNDAIIAALLQHQEDNFSKLTYENRSKIDCNKSVLNKW